MYKRSKSKKWFKITYFESVYTTSILIWAYNEREAREYFIKEYGSYYILEIKELEI